MTTMNCGGGRKLIKNNDNSLHKLVEEYLLANQELTFIRVHDMVTSIQQKSYRFSRMKRPAITYLVEQAYRSYCDSNNLPGNTCLYKPPDDVRTFALDSDSDIEIEEPPPRPTMNNQLKGLYNLPGRPTSSLNTPRTFPSYQGNFSIGFSTGVGRGGGVITMVNDHGNKHPATPTTGNGMSSGVNSGQGWTPSKIIPSSSQQPSDVFGSVGSDNNSSDGGSTSILKDDDGDDDLQIIEFPSSSPKKAASVPSVNKPAAPVNIIQPGSDNTPSSCALRPCQSGEVPVSAKAQQAPLSLLAPNKSRVSDGAITTPVTSQQPAAAVKPVGKGQTIGGDTSQKKPRDAKRKLDDDDEVSTSSKGGLIRMDEQLGKRRKREVNVQTSNYTFDDFGGSEKLLEDICKLLMHLKHPEMYRTLGVTPPRGFLLHGPPGCGKTLLAQAIAGELKLPILKMAATELISGISGESESNIRDVFDQALSVAPCIIFMDEIDSITPKRETASKEMERRIVAQLLSCIDDLVTKPKGDQVLLIGATSRIESIDTALRRAGRFDREICLGIPNEKAREKILRVISKGLKLEANFDFALLAKLTPGYVGADLQALVREAAVQAVTEILNAKAVLEAQVALPPPPSQSDQPMEIEDPDLIMLDSDDTPTVLPAPKVLIPCVLSSSSSESIASSSKEKWITETAPLTDEELANFCINMKDFVKAHKYVQPSAKREGFATVPDTTWEDIGALTDIRDELQVSILGPVKYSAAFQSLGLNAPAGVLLCGPPGCGKTLLAKAVANEAGINFISVKGPELLNMYVGESERAVRQCFQRAKNSAPCVIFFDELDSLCPRRSEGIESGSSSRVVNQLLTEMDGMESRLGVFVMGATNRPDIIDPAILRPGRLDKVLFVNLPSPSERVDILKAITKNGTMPKFAEDVKIEDVGNNEKCENYTGADLASLVREAGIAAFRELILEPNLKNETECLEKDLRIHQRHFETAFTRTKPSVSQKDRQKYEKMKAMHSILAAE